VGARRNVDDAGRGAGFEDIQQQDGQQEVIQVVEGEGHFIAVGGQVAAGEHGPGVVDQDVQAGVALLEAGGSLHDAGQGGQVGGDELDRAAGLVGEPGCDGGAFGSIAADDGHPGTQPRQLTGGNQPDAARAAGDQHRFPLDRSFHKSLPVRNL
jgi:hypothetical protein